MKCITRSLSILLAVLLAVTLAAGCGGQKAPETKKEGVKVSDDWNKVLEDAKKEGKIVLYSSGAPAFEEPMIKKFEEKYGIKVEYNRPGGGEIVIKKYETEVKAGQNLVDGMTLTDATLAVYAMKNGWLDKAKTPSADKILPQYREKEGYYFVTALIPQPIIFNTKMISPDTAPKSYQELADPKWKGKVLMGTPENAGSSVLTIAAWVDTYKWDFIEKLKQNGLAEMGKQAEAVQAVSRGEKPLVVASYSWAAQAIKQGAPLAATWPESLVVSRNVYVIPKNAPHPNATRVFMDFCLTQDYQNAMVKALDLYSVVEGVQAPQGIPKISDLKVYQEDAGALLEKRSEIVQKWRGIMG